MSETVFELVTGYGAVVVIGAAYLSCLALPIPTSLIMLASGAFVSTGDLSLATVLGGAFLGAVLGDQTGYFIGRFGGAPAVERLARQPARRAVLERARTLVERRGTIGVFFSTWLFAPLGPWVNFIAGTAGLPWVRFTIADIAGEAIWVLIYVGLGMTFADQIDTISGVMGNVVGLIAAIGLAGAMVIWIRSALRRHKHDAGTTDSLAN